MGIDDRFAAQLRDDRQTLPPRGPAFGLRAATVGDVRDALGVTEQRFEPAARIGALLASDLLPVIAPERCIRRCVHRTRYTLLDADFIEITEVQDMFPGVSTGRFSRSRRSE